MDEKEMKAFVSGAEAQRQALLDQLKFHISIVGGWLQSPAKVEDALANTPLVTSDEGAEWLRKHDADIRLDEARWWEHLVGNIKPDHSVDHDSECIYCARIAMHQAHSTGTPAGTP